ncbi:glycoside hydrolase family 65 protein [Citreimonas salinaria]|uniref:Trehalose and maltose hydrolase (Possible phosphorylase) n=1 Tax=Citreimonas salinaria TaxID=321339 RepID=A0A1H3MYG1_9RHOB|nr:glycosyl hydrolase family 65 protein [Citreimonas salinaria]SDY81757.1 Trehalose and maltose hydrolase (possible phosphorylase) [Citreimonas salinaria]
MADNPWMLTYERFDPESEGLREALCTLGNGYFATRGAAEESEADEVHYPGTYLAGGYNRRATDLSGRSIENEDLVNLPNWLPLTFRPEGGAWLNLRRMEILDHRQKLDLKRGMLERQLRVRDDAGRITAIAFRRIVHMRHQNLAAIEMRITPETWSGRMQVASSLDGRVINAGVERYRELNSKHLSPLEAREAEEPDTILLVAETNQSHIRIAQAARTRAYRDGAEHTVERATSVEDDHVVQTLTLEVERGETLMVEKTVALFTSHDRGISEPAQAALRAAHEAGRFEDLLDTHVQAWQLLWDRGDIVVDRHPRTQMILRLHVFHLLQTVSPNTIDQDAGVPARGLHGEAYRGHIFWDELFILPYLNFHFPEISRALLLYRYRRLPDARRLAREAGLAGAMYPWQSGSSGREESQVVHLNPRSGRWTPDNSHIQRHVGAAIAVNVWRYWQSTCDHDFLGQYGAEMLIEIARFWASVAKWNDATGRYDIRGIMGPDEFHDGYPWSESPGLDNNGYTNVLAAWVLRRAAEALDHVEPVRRKELESLLSVTPEEIAAWREIASKLALSFMEGGIIAQFDGYDRLKELDWDAYRAKYGDIHRLDRILEAEGDSVNRYKASKQADVLMLFYLFSSNELRDLITGMGYEFDPQVIPRTVDYYLARTSHGSTLSRVVHSWVLARSDRARSWELLTDALESDISDIQRGTTAEGIHLGAMAGTVDLVQRGQTGLEFYDDTLALSPCLPQELQGLHLGLMHRGHWLRLDISCDEVRVAVPLGWPGPHRIRVRDEVRELTVGEELRFPCELYAGGWRPTTEARPPDTAAEPSTNETRRKARGRPT